MFKRKVVFLPCSALPLPSYVQKVGPFASSTDFFTGQKICGDCTFMVAFQVHSLQYLDIRKEAWIVRQWMHDIHLI
jgi:hypothetical protein